MPTNDDDTNYSQDEMSRAVRGNDAMIERNAAVAAGKIKTLMTLAGVVAAGEQASSSFLRKKCGLSADEWHGHGELLASLICFAYSEGFLEWHAKSMGTYNEEDSDAPTE